MPWGPGGTTVGTLQPVNSYIPPGGFTKFTGALAKALAGTGTCTIWGAGASLAPLGGGGTAVTDMLTKPDGVIYRQHLINAGYPIHGDSFLPTASAGVNGFNNLVTYSVAPWTMDVVPAGWLFNGPFTVPEWVTQTTIPLCHATHPSAALGYNARSCSLFTFDLGNQDGGTSTNGRTWSANIDGGANTNITNTGSHLIVRTDFTNLSNTAGHVLNIGNQGAASVAVVPVAVAWYPTTTVPTSGVHYAWFGMPGNSSVSDLMRTDGTGPKLRIERMYGPSNTPTGDPPASLFTANSALAVPFQPNLVLMGEWDDFAFVNNPTNSGSNPVFTVTGAPPEAYAFGLARMFNVFRVAGNCDVIHFFDAIPDSYVSDVTIGSNQQWNIKHYFKERRALAELYGHGWLNIDNEIGETGLAQGFLTAGNPHLTNAGQAFKAGLYNSRLGLP